MKYLKLTVAAAGLLAACTSNPAYNTLGGAAGGSALGCGIGAAVAGIPTLGAGAAPGCAFGAWVGAASGAGLGLATTNPNNPPPPNAWPLFGPAVSAPPPSVSYAYPPTPPPYYPSY